LQVKDGAGQEEFPEPARIGKEGLYFPQFISLTSDQKPVGAFQESALEDVAEAYEGAFRRLHVPLCTLEAPSLWGRWVLLVPGMGS